MPNKAVFKQGVHFARLCMKLKLHPEEEFRMKTLLVFVVLALGFSARAMDDNQDRDMSEIYLSWCDSNNVMVQNYDKILVKENCASSQKTCNLNQRTQGRYVYYSASCLDTSKPRTSEP